LVFDLTALERTSPFRLRSVELRAAIRQSGISGRIREGGMKQQLIGLFTRVLGTFRAVFERKKQILNIWNGRPTGDEMIFAA